MTRASDLARYNAALTVGSLTSTGIDDNATSTAITIDASENVGIGNASPSQALDVTGSIAVSGTVDGRDVATDGTKLDGVAVGATAGGGATEFIATIDLSSTATAAFTGFDSGSYDDYVFKFLNVILATDSQYLEVHTSSNGGASYDTGSNYDYRYMQLSATSISGWQGNTQTRLLMAGAIANIEGGLSGTLNVHGAHLAQRTYTTSHVSAAYAGAVHHLLAQYVGGGRHRTAADVDAIRFRSSSGNMASGTITMYGMKNA